MPSTLSKLGISAALGLAHRWFRSLVFLLFVSLTVLMLYRQVWLPIHEPTPLPLGVTEENPQINTEKLQTINVQRADRVSQQAINFSDAAQIIVYKTTALVSNEEATLPEP